jgi:hypothetical protein
MNEQILFDRLRYMDRLKTAGIPEAQARAHADAMDEALRESVATKIDLTRVQTALENRIDLAVKDLTLRLGGMIVAGFIILASIKFFG